MHRDRREYRADRRGPIQARLVARDIGLDGRAVGETRQATRRLAGGKLDQAIEHGAGDAQGHAGHAHRIEPGVGEGVERPGFAAQLRILALAAVGLGNEHIFKRVGFGRRAAQADRVPGVEQGRLLHRAEQDAHGRPTHPVQPQRAVFLLDEAMRAHPVGGAAAAREIPAAADAIAAGDGLGAMLVGRPPTDDGVRIAIDRARHIGLEIGADQGGAVADEDVPGDRRVVPGDLLDGRKIHARRHLLAADRARQQQPEEPRLVQRRQQVGGNAPRALDLVARGGDIVTDQASLGKRI